MPYLINSLKNINDHVSFRSNIKNNFINKFGFIQKDAINLEKTIYNWSIDTAKHKQVYRSWANPSFVYIYLSRLKTIYFNLANNSELLHNLLTNQINILNLEQMQHQDMNPALWSNLIQKKHQKLNAESSITGILTDVYVCRKCKQNRCSYYQLQTRSADEPMSIFVQCTNCPNRWRC